MRADQANNIDLRDLLARLGHQPVSLQKGGNELWYLSPFRAEKEPSFHISHISILQSSHKHYRYQWAWFDFAEEGGTVIDFIMRLQGHRDLKRVLAYLRKIYPSPLKATKAKRVGEIHQTEPALFSFHGQEAQLPSDFVADKHLEFVRAHEIRREDIYHYLMEDRALKKPIIDRYLLEVYYFNKKADKQFYAFGMRNRSNGYEIRIASDAPKYNKFKSALIARDITFLKGSQPSRRSINIFEGMTDFLSLLTVYDLTQLAGDSIILHSVSSYARAAEIIKGKEDSYLEINTFLDNDTTGQKCTKQFQHDFGTLVKNQSPLFQPYQDLNKMLVDNQKSKPF